MRMEGKGAMEPGELKQSLEEREGELRLTAAWLSCQLKSLAAIAQELSAKADELAAERRMSAGQAGRLPLQPPD